MALDFDETTAPFESEWAWRGGALAGLVATVVMGVAIMATNGTVLRESIAGLYGQQGNLIAGWLAHLIHGTLFGALFALILADPGLYRLTDWRWKTLLAGVVYALILAVFGAGIIMPMWLGLLGFASPPTFPFVTTTILLWHLLYGIVLGVVFPVVEHV